MANQVYAVVTAKILAALEEGTVPWRKPWASGIPRNAATNRPYHGINPWLLNLEPYSDQRWLTYKQAEQMGGNVRKGERSSLITFWKPQTVQVEDAAHEEQTRTAHILRYYLVFNAQQCDGLNLDPIQTNDIEPLATAQAIVDAMPNPPSIDHDGGHRAYYVPGTDSVHLPAMSAFHSAEEFHNTQFHELSHSTGHKTRLDRHGMETGIAAFGSPVYSREELAAEFGAAFLSGQAGISNTLDNSAAYIAGWRKALKADNRLVIQAASQGQKAADYIVGGGQ